MRLLLMFAAYFAVVRAQTQFRVAKQWNYVNFTFRNPEELRQSLATGMYNPEKCIMSGLGYYKGFYYITTPRMYHGSPATLSRISESGSTEPLLDPFPSWKKNLIGECDALQNVQNVQIDAEGMLYVIDSGRINTLGAQSLNLCPAKLIKFDLNKVDGENKATVVYKYEFPDSVASRNLNYLYDLVLDDSYVYISDNSAQDPGLIVFSELEMNSWKLRHGTFHAAPNATSLNVSGTAFETQLNLAGLALDPSAGSTGHRLYYTPLSSFQLFAVDTEQLKNPNANTLKDVQLIGYKASETDGMTMDAQGVLYMGLLGSSSIAMWNTSSTFRLKVIARDSTYIQWPNSFTFNDRGDLVVLGSTLAKFITRTVNLDEPNFRLLSGNVSSRSYVHNRYKYTEKVDHVHFHIATQSTENPNNARIGQVTSKPGPGINGSQSLYPNVVVDVNMENAAPYARFNMGVFVVTLIILLFHIKM